MLTEIHTNMSLRTTPLQHHAGRSRTSEVEVRKDAGWGSLTHHSIKGETQDTEN